RGRQPLPPEREDDDRDDTPIKQPRGPRLRQERQAEEEGQPPPGGAWDAQKISPVLVAGILPGVVSIVVTLSGLAMDTTTKLEDVAKLRALSGSRVSLLDAVPVHNIGLLHRALVIVTGGIRGYCRSEMQ